MTSEKSDAELRNFFAALRDEFEEEGTDRSNRKLVPEGQRPCPICGEFMVSVDEKGILIDRCNAHGMWLDNDELSAILKRSQDSELLSNFKTRIAGEELNSLKNRHFAFGFALGSLMDPD